MARSACCLARPRSACRAARCDSSVATEACCRSASISNSTVPGATRSPDVTAIRRMMPSTCGWIVVDRRDLTVPTNSLVRSTGALPSVTASTAAGGGPPARAAPCPPPQPAAAIAPASRHAAALWPRPPRRMSRPSVIDLTRPPDLNLRAYCTVAVQSAARRPVHPKEIRRMRRGLVISLVIAAGTAALAAPAGFTVQDLVAMDRLSELASSSAHSRLAFTVSTLDREANRRRTRHLDRRCQGRRSAGPPDRRPGQRHQPGVEPGRADHLLPVVAQRLVAGLADVRQPGRRGDAGDEAIRSTSAPSGSRPTDGSSRSRSRSSSTARTSPARPIASPPPRSARRPAASTTRCCSATGTPGRTGAARTCSSRRSTCSTRRRTPPRHRRDEGHGRRRARRSRSAAPRSSRSRPTAAASSSRRATPAAKRRGRRTSICGSRRSTAARSRAT